VIPKILPELPRSASVLELELMLEEVVVKAVNQGLCPPGKQVGGGSWGEGGRAWAPFAECRQSHSGAVPAQ
jgi:hypothetical protein